MRKLFSILVVALLALNLNASQFTQEMSLEGFSAWENKATYDAETKVLTPTVAWGGGQKWLGSYDASQYTQLVLELASACTQNVSFSVYYTAGDGTASQETILSAGATKATIELNGATIEKIFVSLYSETYADVTIAISRIYLVGTNGKQSVVTINNEEKTTENWAYGITLEASLFTDAHVGDQVIINLVTNPYTGESVYYQVRATSNNTDLESLPGTVNVGEAATQVRFTLTEADLAKLRTHGAWISGHYVTLKSVQMKKHAIWHAESTVVGENWTTVENLSADKFTGLLVGDIIKITLASVENDGQLFLSQGNYSEFTVKPNFYFNSAISEPFTVSYAINQSMLDELRANGMIIAGKKFTVTEVYVEAAEAQKVSKEITVTDAGMATLVLPFNVPELPDGVEAYTLSNDGTNEIVATEVNALEADKPVLIIANAGTYTFVSEWGGNADIQYKSTWSVGTYVNGSLNGNYADPFTLYPSSEAGTNHYILQKHGEEKAFYQVLDEAVTVNPYSAFLTCGYNASAAGPKPAPMRIVFRENTTTGVENTVSATFGGSQKILRNGQLYILRNGVEYNVNGQMTK